MISRTFGLSNDQTTVWPLKKNVLLSGKGDCDLFFHVHTKRTAAIGTRTLTASNLSIKDCLLEACKFKTPSRLLYKQITVLSCDTLIPQVIRALKSQLNRNCGIYTNKQFFEQPTISSDRFQPS